VTALVKLKFVITFDVWAQNPIKISLKFQSRVYASFF